MKILVYSHFFAPSIGGVETIVQALTCGLAKRRRSDGAPEFDITVVTETLADHFDDKVFSYRVVRHPGLRHLWRMILDSDLVHIAGPALAPLFLSKIAKKPVTVEHHGFQTICPNGQLFIESSRTPCPGHFMAGRHHVCLRCNARQGWIHSVRLWFLTFVRRLLCSGLAANIAPTEWFAAMLQLPKVVHISHGLDSEAKARVPQSLAEPLVAFQGRLVSTKGVHILLEAAEILRRQGRSFEVVIIGDGPERSLLERVTEERGLATWVKFAGRLPKPQLDDALSRASFLVVPSLGGEVFGLVLTENMLRGIPIIASDLGAFVEVLDGAGRIFHRGDAADLARQMAVLLDDQANAARLGALGLERAQSLYGERQMIEQHAHMYRSLGATNSNASHYDQ